VEKTQNKGAITPFEVIQGYRGGIKRKPVKKLTADILSCTYRFRVIGVRKFFASCYGRGAIL